MRLLSKISTEEGFRGKNYFGGEVGLKAVVMVHFMLNGELDNCLYQKLHVGERKSL